MAENNHSVETYEREDGKRGWRIKSGDDIVATDGGQGYNNEEDALTGLYNIFFGSYDTSFLELYQKWQDYAGQETPSELEPYVRQAENEKFTARAPELGMADGNDART